MMSIHNDRRRCCVAAEIALLSTVIAVVIVLVSNISPVGATKTVSGKWSIAPLAPETRGKHGLVCVAESKTMIVFGGRLSSGTNLNDIWVYNSTSAQWSELLLGGDEPGARQAMLFEHNNGTLWVWGGQGNDSPGMDDMWRANLAGDATWESVNQGNTKPLGRRRMSSVAIPELNQVIMVFGASRDRLLNDVWMFSYTTLTWTQWVVQGAPPDARFDSCCTRRAATNTIICFGGTGRTGDYNDVWELTVTGTPKWTLLSPASGSAVPSERRIAQCYVQGTDLVIATGYQSSDGAVQNDLWAMDLTTRRWTMAPAPSHAPEARDSAQLCVLGSVPYMVAGWGETTFHNDVWTISAGASRQWVSVSTDILAPQPRALHSMVAMGNLIYMAFGSGRVDYNDIWTFDTDKLVWSQIMPKNTPPAARSGASVVTRGATLVFFGGTVGSKPSNEVHEFNSLAQTWADMTRSGATSPSGRYGHGAIMLVNDDTMVVFGGLEGGNKVIGDLWFYNFNLRSWRLATSLTQAPEPRGYHAMQLIRSATTTRIVIAGGYAFQGLHFDRWELETRNANTTVTWKKLNNAIPSGMSERAFIRAEMGAAGSGERIFFAGGGISKSFAPQRENTFFAWDVETGNTLLEPLPLPVYWGSSVFVKRTNFLFGGNVVWNDLKRSEAFTKAVQMYTISADQLCKGSETSDAGCSRCAAGTTYDQAYKDCVPCPAGTFEKPGSGCVACSAGTFSTAVGAVSPLVCLPCTEGTYQDEEGKTTCKTCPSTAYCAVGSLKPQTEKGQLATAVESQPEEYKSSGIPSTVYWIIITFCVVYVCMIAATLIIATYVRTKRLTRLFPEERRRELENTYERIGGTAMGIHDNGLFLFFHELNIPISESLVSKLVLHYDDDGSRSLDFDEIIMMLSDLISAGWIDDDLVLQGHIHGETEMPERFTLKGLDLFKDQHTSGAAGDPMYLKRNQMGGVVSMCFIMGVIAFVVILVSEFVWENQIEERSSLPKVAVRDSFSADLVVTLTSDGGSRDPLACVSSVGSTTCNADTRVATEGLGLLSGASTRTECEFVAPTRCSITWHCTNCELGLTLDKSTMLQFVASDPRVFSNNVTLSVQASSGIPDDGSNRAQQYPSVTVANVSPKQRGLVLRGINPSLVRVEATPTIFKYEDRKLRNTGYHVRELGATTGSTASNVDFYANIGLGVTVQIVVADTSALVITRRDKSTDVSLLSAILGAVSGLSGLSIVIIKRFDNLSLKFRRWKAKKEEKRRPRRNDPTRQSSTWASSPNVEHSVLQEHVEPLVRSGVSFVASKEILKTIADILERAMDVFALRYKPGLRALPAAEGEELDDVNGSRGAICIDLGGYGNGHAVSLGTLSPQLSQSQHVTPSYTSAGNGVVAEGDATARKTMNLPLVPTPRNDTMQYPMLDVMPPQPRMGPPTAAGACEQRDNRARNSPFQGAAALDDDETESTDTVETVWPDTINPEIVE
eukprot:PhM_4_TR7860/c0_g1_i1/m.66161